MESSSFRRMPAMAAYICRRNHRTRKLPSCNPHIIADSGSDLNLKLKL